jgi:hypothetical protein
MLHRQKIITFIDSLGNRIFNITWIKRDGSIRNANVRRKVIRYLKGGNAPSNGHAFIAVYLMPKMTGNSFLYESGYRMLNLETIKHITVNKQCYDITPEPVIHSIDLSITHKEVPDNVTQISIPA